MKLPESSCIRATTLTGDGTLKEFSVKTNNGVRSSIICEEKYLQTIIFGCTQTKEETHSG